MRKIETVVFLSNILTHHQVALSESLWKITEGKYTFIETYKGDRKSQLHSTGFSKKPYVLDYWDNVELVNCLLKDADLVISGSAPEFLVRKRIKTGKLLFRYSERPLKRGLELWRYPDRFLRWHCRNPFWKPIYMLCASAYTARDYKKFGLFKNKTYKWGYFPETKRYPDIEAMMAEKDTTEILWCGRFLVLKHPDDVLKVAREMKQKQYRFHMKLIGTGVMEESLRRMIQEEELADRVSLMGPMTPVQVREHMEKAGIYLFTSDRQEGWGAVLNESMNSGCAVIAGDAIGSVPYLLEDGKNGLVYKSGNVDQLAEKVEHLLERTEEQKRLGLAAYQTITDIWNAEVAAERLVQLAEYILNGAQRGNLFEKGVCSKAD